jgi:hypothetical protein
MYPWELLHLANYLVKLCYSISTITQLGVISMKYFLIITFTIILLGCDNNNIKNHISQDESLPTEELIINNGEGVINNQDTESPQNHPNNTTINETIKANIVDVSVSDTDTEGNYNFSVTIKSDETGCDQYADWWEVVDTEGKLIYRRILTHSHPDEQPFSRSGGRINIQKNEKIYIRAHMNNQGYSGNTFSGTIDTDFTLVQETITFNKELEYQAPLPENCAF